MFGFASYSVGDTKIQKYYRLVGPAFWASDYAGTVYTGIRGVGDAKTDRVAVVTLPGER